MDNTPRAAGRLSTTRTATTRALTVRRRFAVPVSLALGAALAWGGTALASSIATRSAVIHACYSRTSGALRLIHPASGQTCHRTENGVTWNETGPQGPPGPAPSVNIARVATLDWWGGSYDADQYGFNEPDGIAFDGTHLWVTNYLTSTVTELNASNGSWVQTLRNGSYGFSGPIGIAFDGSHLWVANSSGDSLTEFNASDGSWVRTISNSTDSRYGFNFPDGVAFDGTHLWVTDGNGAAVTEISPADGSYVGRLFGGSYGFNNPDGIAADGSGDIWVTNNAASEHGTVTEFSASDGSWIRTETQPGGAGWDNPAGIASDGTHMWVAVTGDSIVLEFNISDGTLASTISDDSYGFIGPVGVAVDGTNVWVTSPAGNRVTELNAADGSLVQKYVTGPWDFSSPTAIAYDGSQMWVTNYTGDSVSDIVDK
jgi:sugar lactone lactonase YvrE